MTKKELLAYVKNTYNTQPDTPFSGDTDHMVLRHRENKKWYGLLMYLQKEKIGLKGDGFTDILNLKCDPILTGSLRHKPGILPAYHMNKEHWITVVLESFQSDSELKDLIDLSFTLTK